MRRLVAAVVAVILVAPARGELLDAIVARVDDEAITWSQLHQERALRWLAGEGSGEEGLGALRGALVRERLMVREAEKLRLPVPDEAQAAEVAALTAAAESARPGQLAALGLDSADVAAWVRRRILARRFSELRREMTFVAEADLRAWHTRHGAVFGDAPIDQVRDELRDYLAQRKNREELAHWIDRQVAEGRVDLIDLPRETPP